MNLCVSLSWKNVAKRSWLALKAQPVPSPERPADPNSSLKFPLLSYTLIAVGPAGVLANTSPICQSDACAEIAVAESMLQAAAKARIVLRLNAMVVPFSLCVTALPPNG